MIAIKWIALGAAACVVGFFGYAEYKKYKTGYYSLPADVPETASIHSFKSGLRAIFLDSPPEVLERVRAVVGFSEKLPSWYDGAWSDCEAPPENFVEAQLGVAPQSGMRLEALCFITIEDDDPVYSGALYSVPKVY